MATTGLNSISDIPSPWRGALAAVQAGIPSAIMAGGCLRDREQGVRVKDLDIFVPVSTNTHEDLNSIATMLRQGGLYEVSVEPAKMYPAGMDSQIIGIVEARAMNCPPLQVIVGEWDTSRIFDRFDFGICQISFDGQKIQRSVDYKFDMARKTFTYVRRNDSDEAFVSSINRWARIKEKYPSWTLNLGTRARTRGVRFASGGEFVVPRSQPFAGKILPILGPSTPNISSVSFKP